MGEPRDERVTYCPICHEPVLSRAVTGFLHVHYAADILSPARLAALPHSPGAAP